MFNSLFTKEREEFHEALLHLPLSIQGRALFSVSLRAGALFWQQRGKLQNLLLWERRRDCKLWSRLEECQLQYLSWSALFLQHGAPPSWDTWSGSFWECQLGSSSSRWSCTSGGETGSGAPRRKCSAERQIYPKMSACFQSWGTLNGN